MNLWHRLLCALSIRDEFDWAPPAWPEVNHVYEQDSQSRCCHHCGGGACHPIHNLPWDLNRMAEIEAGKAADLHERAQLTVALYKRQHAEPR